MRIVFIGSGNLATRLSLVMHEAGATIVQVFSYTGNHARCLAEKLGCAWTDDLSEVVDDADIYLFSIKDSVLQQVVSRLRPNRGVWVHTAGSMPMEIFAGCVARYGVLYPLQTFSKDREVDFHRIPFLLEANTPEVEDLLRKLTAQLSDDVRMLSSQKRRSVHLAAVFACNFTNHIYALAENILKEQDIPMDVLLPLIDETAAKVHVMSPAQAQTGPAIRYDENVINRHLAILDEPDMRAIYELISQSIHKEARHE